jgi:hypothetical protein
MWFSVRSSESGSSRLGTRPVVVQDVAEDGTAKEKTTNRRDCLGEPTTRIECKLVFFIDRGFT